MRRLSAAGVVVALAAAIAGGTAIGSTSPTASTRATPTAHVTQSVAGTSAAYHGEQEAVGNDGG